MYRESLVVLIGALIGVDGIWAREILKRADSQLPNELNSDSLRGRLLLPRPVFLEGAEPPAGETEALVAAIVQSRNQSGAAADDPLSEFLKARPISSYRLWIESSLATRAYYRGEYSRALELREACWRRCKGLFVGDRKRQSYVTDVGVELGSLYAKLGRRESLGSLLRELDTRPLGPSKNWILSRLKQAHGRMHTDPQISFNCGPYAMMQILLQDEDPNVEALTRLREARAGTRGFTLADLNRLSRESDLGFQAMKRSNDGALIFPCVVHWTSDHYAAAIEMRDGKVHIKDPTFRTDTWVDRDVFLREASGHFLIKVDGVVPDGWRELAPEEAKRIHGKGIDATQSGDDDGCPKGGSGCGMASYAFDMFEAAFVIRDTPLVMETPYGPSMHFTLTYYQMGKYDEHAAPSFTTFGSKWMSNWQAFAHLEPGTSSTHRVYLPGGRRETHDTSSASNRARLSGARLMPPGTPDEYVREARDGSKLIFGQKDAGSPVRYYLTEVQDAIGNSVTLQYNTSPFRLDSVSDNFGRMINFEYDYGTENGKEYFVTRVYETIDGSELDPPREVVIEYNENDEIESIEDVVNITSSFSYDDPNQDWLVTSMTTPYGTTTFDYQESLWNQDPDQFVYKVIEVTDPEGLTEAVMYTDKFSNSLSELNEDEFPPDSPNHNVLPSTHPDHLGAEFAAGMVRNDWLYPRIKELHDTLTLYWDKKAYKYHKPDYTTGRNWDYAQGTYWTASMAGPGGLSDPDLAYPIPEVVLTPGHARRYLLYRGTDTWYSSDSDHSQPLADIALITDENGDPAISEVDYIYYDDPELANYRQVKRVIDEAGRFTEFIYDEDNGIDLLEARVGLYVDDPSGPNEHPPEDLEDEAYQYTLRRINYAADHLPSEIYYADGTHTSFVYNAAGQVTQVTNQRNEVFSFTYDWPDGFVDPTDGEDPEENDGFLMEIRVTDPVSAHNLNGALISTFSYHDNTAFLKEAVEVLATDGSGEPTKTLTTEYVTYDNLGRVLEVTYPNGSTEEFSYRRWDGQTILDLVSHRNAEGQVTEYEYNGNRQPVVITDPEKRKTYLKWCSCGHLEELTDALGRTTHWVRELQGRVQEKILPDGRKTRYSYEPRSGRLSAVTFPNEQEETYASVEYAYYVDGSLARISYPEGENDYFALFEYEAVLGRLAKAKWFDENGTEQTINYHYNPLQGDLDQVSLGAGMPYLVNGPWTNDRVYFTYDDLGRLISRRISTDVSPVDTRETVLTGIDALGRVHEVQNDLGTFTTVYSASDKQDSRPDYITGPNGFKVDYSYLALSSGGYLNGIDNLYGTNTISEFEYSYDPMGRIRTWSKNQPHGSPAEPVRFMEFVYDLAGQLVLADRRDTNESGSLEERETYGYDRAGNRTAKVTGDEPTVADFNERNQLISGDYHGTVPLLGTLDEWASVEVTHGSRTYPARVRAGSGGEFLFDASIDLDSDGTTNFSVKASDFHGNASTANEQFVASGSGQWIAMTYDDNGNTKTRTVSPPGGPTEVFTYHWDRENRLVKVERTSGPTTEFVYNAFGERVKIIENADGTPNERRFILSGTEILQELDSNGAVRRNYYPQGEERFDETGYPQYFYTRDHLGNIRELVKKSDGTVVGRWDYSPYGIREDLLGGAGSVECEFGFTGHFTHGDSDLVLTYFRGYMPELGRWLSPDPLDEAGGINLYAYVGGDPISFYDPDGLVSRAWLDGFWAGITDAEGWKQSAAAAADGFIPFADPFEGAYDPCDKDLQVGKFLGGLSRDIALAPLLSGGTTFANVAAQARNPILYELGSTTVSPATWRWLKHADVVTRGRILAAQHGGVGKAFANASTFTRAASNWHSGLTPLGTVTVIGGVHAGDATFEYLSDPCD